MLKLITGVLLFTALAHAAQDLPPAKLEWNDLVNRPERWPTSCKLIKKIRFGPVDVLDAGTVCRVIGVQGGQAQLLADNSQFEAPPEFVDLLDEANATWSRLSPEQRALTPDMVVKDRSLWPASVTVAEEQNFGAFTIKAGETLPMLFITPQQELALFAPRQTQWAPVPLAMTDFFTRARELSALAKEKRPGRIASLFDGKVVDVDGKPAQLKAADHYIIYWSGSQCEWCAQYNAKWVDYFKKNLADRTDVQVIGICNDQQMPVYFAYAKKNAYAWPILLNENKLLTSALGELGMIQMPGIIVFDKDGTIVASTLRQRGTPLETADGVVKQIDKLLASPK
jgi:hypothetical protein